MFVYKTKEDSKKAFIDELESHRKLIKEAFEIYGEEFCKILEVELTDLKKQISLHDLSKCENRDEEYGFTLKFYPNEDENIPPHLVKIAFDKARLSHYHNNKDHPEFWVYIEDKDGISTLNATAMEPVYVCEMILDWIASSKKAGKLPADIYWAQNRNYRCIHEKTVDQIDMLIDCYVHMRDNEN